MYYQSIEVIAELEERTPSQPGASGRYRNPTARQVTRTLPPPDPGMVLVGVHNVSICGSDIHALQIDTESYSRFSGPARSWEHGLQFGHEFSGKVLALGPGARGLTVGSHVTADSLVPCGRCRTCRANQPNYCRRSYLLGFEADGAFGEYALVPAGCLHPVDRLVQRYGVIMALRIATLAEPLGVALHAFTRARRWVTERRPSALVWGAGPIGLFFAVKARLAGFDPVAILEPNPARARLARQFIDYVYHPSDYDSGFVWEVFGVGPSVICEASGAADANALLGALSPGGAVVTVARTGQKLCLSADTLITRGQAVLGSRGHVGHVPEAVELLADKQLDPALFITQSLRGLDELMAALSRPERLTDQLKVVVDLMA